jgi:antitoxin FitA
MSVNLSIKNVPEDLANRLRQRAARHHRSLQGELIAILEEALSKDEAVTPAQLLSKIREMKIHTTSDSALWVRENRDAR